MDRHNYFTVTHNNDWELSDQFGISNLIGEYRARCLFSKVWGLREAVINKVRLLLQEQYSENPGLSSCINALCAVVRVGIDDKLSQLMFSAIPLLDDIITGIRKYVLFLFTLVYLL
jgi:hypothetical protein